MVERAACRGQSRDRRRHSGSVDGDDAFLSQILPSLLGRVVAVLVADADGDLGLAALPNCWAGSRAPDYVRFTARSCALRGEGI